MKLSELKEETLNALTDAQKWELICGDIRDDGASAPVALLLGTRPHMAIERALAAAELYRAGRVRYIVPSGGVEWEYEGETISEALFMARILKQEGVPEEAIILENEARTTKENMIYGTLQINRALRFDKIDHVIIVTSQVHMQRSIALAKAFLPRKVSVSAYPAMQSVTKEEWLRSEGNVKLLDSSLRLTKDLVDYRVIEDIEVQF